MKKGTHDLGFYFSSEEEQNVDTLIGVSLGWDHTAEHEFGINGIQADFGIPHERTREKLGLERCRISRLVSDFFFVGPNFLVADPWNLQYSEPPEPGEVLNQYDHCLWLAKESKFREAEHMAGCWSDSGFGLIVDPEHEEYMAYFQRIARAFEELDVTIHISGSDNPFANGGLCLSIYSQIPEEHLKRMAQGDLDLIELEEAAAPFIKQITEQLVAGPVTPPYSTADNPRAYFFSLRPSWKDRRKNELMFWLNPCQQTLYRSGWFDFAQLMQWAQENTGPVTKAWVEKTETEQLEKAREHRNAQVEAVVKELGGNGGPTTDDADRDVS